MKTSLVNTGNREVQVVRVEPRLPVAAEVTLSRSGNTHEVSVRLPAPAGLQNLEGAVELFTDHPTEPVVRVPVRGWIAPKQPFKRVDDRGAADDLLALTRAALLADEQVPAKDFVNRIFGGRRDDRVVSLLLQAMTDDLWLIRSRAVEVLGLLKSERALAAIRTAVTDDVDEEVRRAAVAALVHIAGKDALPELVLALQDDDDWVRDETAQLLGTLGDKRAIPALTRALSDEDEDVRSSAKKALQQLGGKGGTQ
jgi:hypothetical protein